MIFSGKPVSTHGSSPSASFSGSCSSRSCCAKKVDYKEATTMAQDNEYVQKLIAARDREVAHRRDVARTLAEKQNRGDTENIREAFIKIQDVIEAIERAVWHERYIADPKSGPLSPSGL